MTVDSPRAVVPGRLGILGGTFDPIHIGHLAAAEEARQALGLAQVLFIPAGDPWQKADRGVSAAHHRLAMVELAVASNPFFAVSRVEVERPGPTYTVTTLEELAAAERAAGRVPDLWFILSTAVLERLPTWHRPETVVALTRFAVVPRLGTPAGVAGRFAARYPAATALFLDGPLLGIAGTDLRDRVAAGRSIRYLVPPAVESYIAEYALYRGPVPAAPPEA